MKYLVKFNVKLLEQFSPSMGPRQGDPLSPFLFLFVADAFFALLNKSMVDNVLEPVVLCWNAPEISLLLFADDSLLFLGRLCQKAECTREGFKWCSLGLARGWWT